MYSWMYSFTLPSHLLPTYPPSSDQRCGREKADERERSCDQGNTAGGVVERVMLVSRGVSVGLRVSVAAGKRALLLRRRIQQLKSTGKAALVCSSAGTIEGRGKTGLRWDA